MTLRNRCKDMCLSIEQGYAGVDDLMAFVIAEAGKVAEASLEETLPLCLYFTTSEERDEFIEAVLEAKPGMRTRKV